MIICHKTAAAPFSKDMINNGLFSSNSNEWATPKAFFAALDAEFHFTLDPCATPENAKCKRFYTIEDDGLTRSWHERERERVFVNPPYGREISKWVKKAYEESRYCEVVVMLIPARTDTSYFHQWIYHKSEIRFVRGRLHFNESKQGAPFPSMVVIYDNRKSNE